MEYKNGRENRVCIRLSDYEYQCLMRMVFVTKSKSVTDYIAQSVCEQWQNFQNMKACDVNEQN